MITCSLSQDKIIFIKYQVYIYS